MKNYEKRLCEICNTLKDIVFQKNARIGSSVSKSKERPTWICLECHRHAERHIKGKKKYGTHRKHKKTELDDLLRRMGG